MTIIPTIAAAGLCAAFLLIPAASAQQSKCGPEEQVGLMLMQQFGESVVGRGVAGRSGIIQLYLSPGGSFTIVVTRPDGMSCGIGGGTDWEFAHPQAPGRKS